MGAKKGQPCPTRGFGSPNMRISRARHLEICSRAGKTAHALGVAHEWDSKEAAAAGRLGGLASVLARRRRQAEKRRAS